MPQNGSQSAAQASIDIGFDTLTSFNGSNTITGRNIDGYTMGNLINISTEQDSGNIKGVYSNGLTRVLAKLGLMSISNPEGLQKIGSSYYAQTPNSDKMGSKNLDQIFSMDSGGITSSIHGNALEGSNVDLSQELTDMIVTQRSYSAAGKIITTAEEMLQDVIALKRY